MHVDTSITDGGTTAGRRILVLGGDPGGVHTALELEKALARSPDLDVTLVGRGWG
jgi:hypothetical protein